jgi:hypothetical protein
MEKAFAALAFKANAQRLLQSGTHRLERRRIAGRLDPRKAVASIRGE